MNRPHMNQASNVNTYIQNNFAYRPDGGQAVGVGGLKANAITRLNMGKKIILSEIDPFLLGQLPGLGKASASKAIKRGCLTAREGRNNMGLVSEGLCAKTRN